jgi:hypothetical protein
VFVLKVNCCSETMATSLFSRRMFFDNFSKLLLHNGLSDIHDLIGHVHLEHVLHGSVGTSACNGMSSVGRSNSKGICSEVIENFLAHADTTEGNVSARNTLGKGDHIGLNSFEVLVGEERTSSVESTHDLIRNQQDAILVTKSADSLEVLLV